MKKSTAAKPAAKTAPGKSTAKAKAKPKPKAAPKKTAATKTAKANKAASPKKPAAAKTKTKAAVKTKASVKPKKAPAKKSAKAAPATRGLLVPRTLRVHAIPLADDNGGRKYPFTVADLAKGIARANLVLAGAKVTLAFDPAKDWHPRNSTELNNEENAGANWWLKGNAEAARIPGKIVIFFRHGKGPTAVGWGHAYPPNTGQSVPSAVALPTDNVAYVSMPHCSTWDTPDRGNFLAHEISHYLGLFHTHPGWGTSEIYQGATTAADFGERLARPTV